MKKVDSRSDLKSADKSGSNVAKEVVEVESESEVEEVEESGEEEGSSSGEEVYIPCCLSVFANCDCAHLSFVLACLRACMKV